MNGTASAAPAPPATAPAAAPTPARLRRPTPADLDARIRLAEERLIAREENLHRRVGALRRRLGDSLRPRRLLAPAVVAGAAIVGLLWWRRRHPPRDAEPWRRPAPAARATDAGTSPLWLHLVGLVWPLMPPQVRSRLSPATVNLLFSVALPLLGRLVRPARRRG